MKTQLFFDDQWLVGRDNMVRHYGKPKLIDDSVYKDSNLSPCVGQINVFEVSKNDFLMIYTGYNCDRKTVICAAKSTDGIHWKAHNVAKENGIENPIAPNQCIDSGICEAVAVIDDFKAPKSERFKLLSSDCLYGTEFRCDCRLMTSQNGTKYNKTDIKWHNTLMGCEPLGSALYDEKKDTYFIYCRPVWGDRRICKIETKDFKNFTEPELVLQADSIDEPLMDIQGMFAFNYEGIKIGYLYCYHVPPEPKDKAIDGKVDCQLAYSLNGRAFQRSLREPFMGNGAPGSLSEGMIWPSAMRRGKNGDIYITSSVSALEHGYFQVQGAGAIVTHSLRCDGWVYLEPKAGQGRICTRCMYYEGGGFGINIECPSGTATVALYDDDIVPRLGHRLRDFHMKTALPLQGTVIFGLRSLKTEILKN